MFDVHTNDGDFQFIPVKVDRGRKFRGEAYFIGEEPTYGRYSTWSLKLWDPKSMKMVYVNPDYMESRDASPETVAADKKQYIESTIKNTIEWCRLKSPTETEAKRFARNILMKFHPELKQWVDEALPDQRDVVTVVENTLRWAMNLRTKPMVIYGKVCPGGQPYPEDKVLKIAYKALAKKGVTELVGFQEAWKFMLQLFNFKDKLAENIS